MLAAVPAAATDSDADTYTAANEKTEKSVISFTVGGVTTYYENTAEAMSALTTTINAAEADITIEILKSYTPAASIGHINNSNEITIAFEAAEGITLSSLTGPFVTGIGYSPANNADIIFDNIDISSAEFSAAGIYDKGWGGLTAYVPNVGGSGAVTFRNCDLSNAVLTNESNGPVYAAGFVGYTWSGADVTVEDYSVTGCKFENKAGSAGGVIGYACHGAEFTISGVSISNCTMSGAAYSGWWQVGIVYAYNMTEGSISNVTVGKDVVLSQNGITMYAPEGYDGYDYLYGFNSRDLSKENQMGPLEVDGVSVPVDTWVSSIADSKAFSGCAPVDYKNQYGKPLFDFNTTDGSTSGSMLVGKVVKNAYSFGKTFTVPEGFVLEIVDGASISGGSDAVVKNYGTIRCATADDDGKVTATTGTIDFEDLALVALNGSTTILSSDIME